MRSETAQMNAATVRAPTTRRPQGSASSLRTQAIGFSRHAPALVFWDQTASKPATLQRRAADACSKRHGWRDGV